MKALMGGGDGAARASAAEQAKNARKSRQLSTEDAGRAQQLSERQRSTRQRGRGRALTTFAGLKTLLGA